MTAPAGLDADGLATAILVPGREKGLKLLRAFPKAEAFHVFKDGQTVSTPGFSDKREIGRSGAQTPDAPSAAQN